MDKNIFFVVILNWHGWKDTQKCLESIVSESKGDEFCIILVDNGSDMSQVKAMEEYCLKNYDICLIDDKEVFLQSQFRLGVDFLETGGTDKIIFIKNNENLGFARGNNVAIEFVQNQGGRYVLLLNNDTEIEEDALNKMMNVFQENNTRCNYAAVIPQIRYFYDKDKIWNCGGKINRLGIRKYNYSDVDSDNVPQTGLLNVDYGTGCVLLLDLIKTGKLSEKYFFGEEDLELALRLKKKRLNTVCILDAIVYHKVGASRDKFSDKFVGNMVYHYSQRLSNLKDYLNPFYWNLTVAAHFLSSIRILIAYKRFNVRVLGSMWRDILVNVKNLKQFTQADFARISRKNY